MNKDTMIKRLVMTASATMFSGRLYNTSLELAENIKKRLFENKCELFNEQYEARDQMKIRLQFSEDGISISVPSLVNEKMRPVYFSYVSLPEDQLRAMTEII